MPQTAAQFRHDPAGGAALADRMVITQLPDKKPRALGTSSAFQQRQDLAQLEAISVAPETSTRSSAPAPTPAPTGEACRAERPTAAPAVEAPVVEVPATEPSTDAVDKLSAWLLEHANLTGPT
jgi:hypothetical protein